MKLVILESPYAANAEKTVQEHIDYARLCLRDALGRGESPIASHLLLTQDGVLDDSDKWQRALGIEAGLAWHRGADYAVFYEDMGWSRGMLNAKKYYDFVGLSYEIRKLGILCRQS